MERGEARSNGGVVMIKKTSWFQRLGEVFRLVASASFILMLLAGVICWLIGWRSIPQYATALRYIAVAVFIFASVSFVSNYSSGHRIKIQQHVYAYRTDFQQIVKDRDNSFQFFLLSGHYRPLACACRAFCSKMAVSLFKPEAA